MCGRFSLRTPTETIAAMFDGLRFPKLVPRYNIAPTQSAACVRQSSEGVNEVALLRWGLIPSWATDIKMAARMINARGDTVAAKPAFRAAFKQRRCLVLADGFFEWKTNGKEKQPYYITRVDDQPFCMAGLWERWSGGGQTIESFTIITTDASSWMRTLHDRMPVILGAEWYDAWLDRDFADRDALTTALVPCADDLLKAVTVSKFVNKPSNDSPDCVRPIPTVN
jgi:putative SOS response-associated peptidase YedK